MNGDCWPSQCQICIREDEQHELDCRGHGERCSDCDERMCSEYGPEPRACGTTCGDCPCDCTACRDEAEDREMERLVLIERERGVA